VCVCARISKVILSMRARMYRCTAFLGSVHHKQARRPKHTHKQAHTQCYVRVCVCVCVCKLHTNTMKKGGMVFIMGGMIAMTPLF